jgi:hypothetical protein
MNRFKKTQFDDVDFAIYFQRSKHITGRVVGEEVQHAIDFTMEPQELECIMKL